MKGIQSIAARGLLGLSQREVAEATGVAPMTLRDIEKGTGNPGRVKVDAVFDYYIGRGIVFINEPGLIGVLLRSPEHPASDRDAGPIAASPEARGVRRVRKRPG
jgi:transcriptional regulator with XRE-family HTH domain